MLHVFDVGDDKRGGIESARACGRGRTWVVAVSVSTDMGEFRVRVKE